jgi:hypothetical protein
MNKHNWARAVHHETAQRLQIHIRRRKRGHGNWKTDTGKQGHDRLIDIRK